MSGSATRSEATGWKPFTKLDADSWHIQQLAFADGGSRLVATTTDNGIRLWDMPGGTEMAMEDADPLRDQPVMALAVSPDGDLFAVGNDDGGVELRKTGDGTLVRSMPKQEYMIGSLTFAAGGTRLVASCGYRCADRHRSVVWTVADGQEVLQYRGHDGTVYASASSADGTLSATAGGTQAHDPAMGPADRRAEETAAGRRRAGDRGRHRARRPPSPGASPIPVRNAFSCPDVMGDLTMKLDLPTADRFFENPAECRPMPAGFRRAVLSANGWSLQANPGGKDNLENAVLEIGKDGEPLQKIENDATNGYLHAAFTLVGDGARLITGGNDGTLIEYDSATAKISGEFIGGHSGEINAIAVPKRPT